MAGGRLGVRDIADQGISRRVPNAENTAGIIIDLLLAELLTTTASELLTRASAGRPKPTQAPNAAKLLDESLLGDVFGIEMAAAANKAPPAPRRKPTPTKPATARTRAAAPAGKTRTAKAKAKR